MKTIKLKKLGMTVVLTGIIFLGASCSLNQNKSTSSTATSAEVNKNINYAGVEGKNAFELLQQNYQVDFSSSDFGNMVKEIDGIKNTTDTYWMFYVNGALSQVAADKYITKSSDKIEWKYEKSQ